MPNKKKAKQLKIRWRMAFCSPLLFALLQWIENISYFFLNNETFHLKFQTVIIYCMLLSLILFITGAILIWLAWKYEVSTTPPSFLKPWETLTPQQEHSLRKFSRWWFWCPVLMLYFSKNYLWWTLVLLFDAVGILPRTIMGRYGRRRLAEKVQFKSFEEYEKKAKKRWLISSCVGILLSWAIIRYTYYTILKFFNLFPYFLAI